MRAFCFVCVNFTHQHWCLGLCHEKQIHIHKPFRNCTKYIQSANVIDDPSYILTWYKQALDIAKIKYDFVERFFAQIELEGQPEEEEKEE